MKDLRKRTLSGLTWTLASQGGQQLVGFACSVALARLLTPSDFGLVGKALVFTGFARLLSDFGLSASLIQDQAIDELKKSSAFWANFAVGATITALLWVLAPQLAAFYDDARLVDVLRPMSFSVLIASLNTTQRALLRKSLDFKPIAVADNVGMLCSCAVAITLAMLGHGVLAIVWQTLSANLVVTALLWARADFRPQLTVSRDALRGMWGFSSNLLGANVVNYWIRNLDNLLVGKLLGSVSLGIYMRAYSTMLLPVNQVTQVTGQVMFPSMSLIQLDHDRLKRLYLRALAAIALVTAPLMLGLLVAAEPFVLTVYGEKWAEVVPILRILCLVGLAQSLNATVGWLYTAKGRTDWQFRFVLFGGILTYAAFVIGLRWGLVGIATAYAIRVYSTTWLNYYLPGKLIGMRVREVARAVAPPIGCAGAMALCVLGVDALLTGRAMALRLVVDVATGAACYFGLLHALRIKAYAEMLQLLRERLARKKRPSPQAPPA